MAARTFKIRQTEETRLKIKSTELITRLTQHALGQLDKPMEATQVTAAIALLKKTIPDLSAVDMTAVFTSDESIILESLHELDNKGLDEFITGLRVIGIAASGGKGSEAPLTLQ